MRGGDQPGDQPRALGPHLDYHQDDEERNKFYEKFPLPSFSNRTEPHVLTGSLDTEKEKLGVMLGLWKPLYPKQVMDYPLAVMDASTFEPENQILYHLHMNLGVTTFNNLNGAISYNPAQKWYYFSKQSTTEVLVFHQYSKVVSVQFEPSLDMTVCRGSGGPILTPPSSTRTVRGERRTRRGYQPS